MRLVICLSIFALLVGFGIWFGMSAETFSLIAATLAAIELIAGLVWFFVMKD